MKTNEAWKDNLDLVSEEIGTMMAIYIELRMHGQHDEAIDYMHKIPTHLYKPIVGIAMQHIKNAVPQHMKIVVKSLKRHFEVIPIEDAAIVGWCFDAICAEWVKSMEAEHKVEG